VSEQESTETEPGLVIEQDPSAGADVAKGSTVAFVVATAPPEVEVPDVTTAGVPEDEARASLEELGFEVVVRDEEVPDPTQDGIVVAQNPAPGATAPPGSEVVIRVGRLAEPTPTPEVPAPEVPTPEVPAP
jgi:serine/threonine-protein kinase